MSAGRGTSDRLAGEPEVVVLPTAEAAAAEAARRLREAACRAVEAAGRFRVALAGGSTPERLYELLAEDAWRQRLPWDRMQIFWSDERCVPPDHPDSNYGMAERTLLRHVDVVPGSVHRMHGELGAALGAAEYEATLEAELGEAGLDFVLLGVGTDGHTASLFPGDDLRTHGIEAKPRRAAPAVAPDGSPRITLTVRELNAATEVLFLVTGERKRGIVGRILGRGSPRTALPASLVRPARPPTWLLDEAAAELDV